MKQLYIMTLKRMTQLQSPLRLNFPLRLQRLDSRSEKKPQFSARFPPSAVHWAITPPPRCQKPGEGYLLKFDY